MTQEQIACNKLIAEFDGWERKYPGTAARNMRDYAQFEAKDGRHWHCLIADGVGEGIFPPFHSDWNLLMPVVDKIEGDKYYIGIDRNFCMIGNLPYIKSCENLLPTIKGESKIDGVHKQVVQFITWYNQQNTQK